MIQHDAQVFVEADYLYFEPGMDSQGIVRPFARGPLGEVMTKAHAEPAEVQRHLYVTVGERSWHMVDGRRVELLRPQFQLMEVTCASSPEDGVV